MCAKIQTYSATKHLLLSARGRKWKKAFLVMFTVFIDDSGTAPDQHVAIASALIVPSNRIESLDRQWARFTSREGIPDFHSSECVAAQKDTPYEGWSLQRQKKACARVRRITKNHFVRAFSFAVNKVDFDEVVNADLKEMGGTKFHYTWAIRHVIGFLGRWREIEGVKEPFEYIFDWMGNPKRNKAKQEIELVMAQAEYQNPGLFEGHFSFRKRQQHPALQCVDLIAWSYYQLG